MDDWQDLAETVAAYLLLAVPGALAAAALWWRTPKPRPAWLLPLLRIRRISWQGIDIFCAFFVLYFVTMVVQATLEQAGLFKSLYGEATDPSTQSRQELWSMCLGEPLVLGLVVLGLQQLRGTQMPEYGLTPVRAGVNLRLGVAIWLVLTPLVLALSESIIFVLGKDAVAHHPLELAGQQSLAPVEWLLMVAGAVMLGPLLEEILFRGLLLGWQLRRGPEAQATVALNALFFAAFLPMLSGDDNPKPYQPGPFLFVMAMLPGMLILPYLQQHWLPQIETEPIDLTWFQRSWLQVLRAAGDPRAQPGLAIFTNALFFGAMHAQAWPSPIPLFFLALGLGWLRYRSASLVGPVLLHGLFNAVAVFTLLLKQTVFVAP